jgi:organic radical activating enzyme
MTDQNYTAGDLNHQTIEEIWNGEPLKKLRQQMLNNEEPQACIKCFNSERASNQSTRIYKNREFANKIVEIPTITESDGTCNKLDLRYWDFRFSNICNFRCRSCGPRYSSSWLHDAIDMGYVSKNQQTDKKVIKIDQVDNLLNYDFVEKYIDTVEHIYFAGGEPLLMDEHWQILELLTQKKKFNVKLRYNTNLSTLTYKKKNVLDYWDLWGEKIQLGPSIDEIGARAELIRKGTVWGEIENNLKLISNRKYRIHPGITVGAWNVFRIPVILDHLIELGIIHPKEGRRNFYLGMLVNPSHYHMHILSDKHRTEIKQELLSYIQKYHSKYSVDLTPEFLYVLSELDKPHSPSAAKQFLYTTYKLDKIRGENLFDTIPELSYIRDLYPEIQ